MTCTLLRVATLPAAIATGIALGLLVGFAELITHAGRAVAALTDALNVWDDQ